MHLNDLDLTLNEINLLYTFITSYYINLYTVFRYKFDEDVQKYNYQINFLRVTITQLRI